MDVEQDINIALNPEEELLQVTTDRLNERTDQTHSQVVILLIESAEIQWPS